MDQQYAPFAMYSCATMAFVSLGLFAALVIEIARNEVPKERMSILRSVATPFNICLELMAFSLILIFASESAVLIILNDKSQQNQLIIRQAFRSWGIALFKLTYLHYSYVRTYPIIEQEFPRAVWPVWVFMGASTVVTVIPTLCRTLRIWIPLEILLTIKNHASVSTYVSLSLMDFIFLVTFIKHLQFTKTEGESLDKHFAIISKFGIVAVILFSSLTVWDIIFVNTNSEVYLILVEFHFVVIFVILGSMKIALRILKNSKAQEQQRIRDLFTKELSARRTILMSQDTVVIDDKEVDPA
ncbi:hypothetical protein BCR33DRAFT_804120 [Rhizoclosmatium globosum]|uniref:Uncharacterized protein n=1 Tax=Rhizoclosmatium globosum TaxID=329046 RepID=A0A1Y2CNU4_9FUNG|nr:hypothetical protein BCR33DRAFT_804120 [Rhizoclosmatium globosum]|eukprot:ORY48708.1 hypothetical protein BCR33DRAFT_804120 [Rhizoclosmatium globosum]